MKVGIIGHEAKKFTDEKRHGAILLIDLIIRDAQKRDPKNLVTIVSGHCHLGGIDIWAEDIANALNLPTIIHEPKELVWHVPGGFKDRNLAIANDSDEIHVIVVKEFPPGFRGVKYGFCYHCNSATHVRASACWTAKQARAMGKPTHLHIL